MWKCVCVEIVKTWWSFRYIRCGIGTPCLRDHIGCGLGQWGTPLRRPLWPVPCPEWSLSTLYHCAKTSLLCCIILWPVTWSVYQCVSFIVDLSETSCYFGPWYGDTPNWGSYWVWARPMGGAITSPPIGWSHTQNDPCWPYISLCRNFIIVLNDIVFSDLYCISMCKLNRFIVDLSETPRYFGPWYRDTPT